MLRAENVTVRYGAQTVVNGLSFELRAGQWLMLVGPNGAGKTTLLIAHRISTVERLDKIIFLDDGKIEAVGPHDELYTSCPKYRRMVDLQKLEDEGWRECPVCIAKTQYSFSDDAKLLGAPVGHTLHIRQVRLNAGAGFVVAFAGDIIAMPGLPKVPAAEAIDVDENGEIVGLF